MFYRVLLCFTVFCYVLPRFCYVLPRFVMFYRVLAFVRDIKPL